MDGEIYLQKNLTKSLGRTSTEENRVMIMNGFDCCYPLIRSSHPLRMGLSWIGILWKIYGSMLSGDYSYPTCILSIHFI